ncbi:tetratricopeptide repeat protein [Undibacterium sp. TJN25]|uniref:tetratricopeptide repeat protein n=1 Tax=Undibacterium sp. TJN25 TaxID=3413056 RepID=UPI003BF0F465
MRGLAGGWLRACLLMVLLVAGANLPAHAQGDAGNADFENLYLDALQALSERRLDDAKALFTQLIEKVPQHAGAWMELAVMQCDLGNKAEAERLFQGLIDRYAPPPAILEIINQHRASGCNAAPPASHYSFTLDRGIDSNVNQGASNPNFTLGAGTPNAIDLQLLPEFLPRQDQYTTISADYMREVSSNGSVGFAQLRVRQYDTLSQYNTIALAAGFERPWRLGNWGLRTTGMLGLLTLDGHLYQKQELLQARVTPPLNLPAAMQFSVVGGLTHLQYPTQINYDSNIWELRGLLSYQSDKYNLQTSLAYMSDLATGPRQGGDRNGWFASAQGRTQLYGDIIGELGWTRQIWQNELVYSPGLINQERHQDTQIFRAAAIFPVRQRQSVQIELRNVSNKENISLFQYNSKSLQVSWRWQSL